MTEEVSFDKLVITYRKVRSAKEAVAAEYEQRIAELEEQLKLLSGAMKDFMLSKGGLKTVRTDYGTVTLGTSTRYTTHDWEEFHAFLIKYDALDLLEKRIAQKNMDTFLKENPRLVPPGLDASTEYTISVRKPSK